jgi:hypothetical protein
MPKKTAKTTQNQNYNNTASYGWQNTPDTADISAYRDYRPEVDPTIGFRAGSAKRQLANSFINPLGGASTPQRDEAIRRSMSRGIDEQAGMESRAGAYDVNQQRAGQLGSLAALTAPRLVQQSSSGTSSGTNNTSMGNNLFGDILGIGQGAASTALM